MCQNPFIPRENFLMIRIASLALLALVTPYLVADPSPITLKKGDKIVFLGDSITAGGNKGKGYIQVIRDHLAEKKNDLGIECIGAGVSGNKVPDLQKRVDSAVISKKPSL